MTTNNKWDTEVATLQDGEDINYLKVEEGQTKIKFLDDGTAHTFDWEGETIEKVNFKVEVSGKAFTWSVTKGKTINSLYGQIAHIGASKGTLVGQTITLLVKGQKKQRQYIVMEALDLTKKTKQEKVE